MSTDTTVQWKPVEGADAFVVRWRRTDANQWQNQKTLGPVRGCDSDPCPKGAHAPISYSGATLPHIRVDDWVFGVSSVSKDGFESPVASAVPGGAFKPYVAPPAKP